MDGTFIWEYRMTNEEVAAVMAARTVVTTEAWRDYISPIVHELRAALAALDAHRETQK